MMPSPRALVARVLRPLLKAAEGEPRRGPFHLPITGGWLPDGAPINWWQTGLSPTGGERSAVLHRAICGDGRVVAGRALAAERQRRAHAGELGVVANIAS